MDRWLCVSIKPGYSTPPPRSIFSYSPQRAAQRSMSSKLPMACMRSPITQTASTIGMGSYRVTIFAPVYSFNFSVQNTCHLLGLGHWGLPQQRFLRRLGNMLPHEKARANASLASTEISKSNAKEFVFLTRCNHSFLKIVRFRCPSSSKILYIFCIVFLPIIEY